MNTPNTPTQYHFFQNGKNEQIDAHLPIEASVSLTVNGEVWLTFMCTPSLLEALAIGFLFNEGIVKDFDEVADVRVCEHGDNVDVWLNHAAEKPKKWTRTSGCGGGMTSVEPNTDIEPAQHQNGVILDPKQIPVLLKMLDENQTLYRQTGGLHTSLLTDGKESIVSAEDIGRHNTLDKIAGQMLMEGIKPKTSMLLTTGRISSEMMQKSLRLGVSVVISRTSPSSISVELAEQQGVTLIGYAKRHRFNVYTHPERILSLQEIKEI
ncbi:MAG: formate dehydrogenase accessory sulfurtransferase FdhD [Anaerolineae bacterium]|jgi:FdhD protein|nr:formate dehydrogenase accessory sulfurtransferase FdhD [Anaerolineae bacterium]MBT7070137.1 formate dehydrogenase accessory sulfurtransferase FdhD [Anaerolineae bacterium]MBT7326187.1 formate dehydrogenase accessory sulfurtransferase FdhD [Anaerolineae bacterium]